MTSFHSGTMMQAEYFLHCVTIWQISQLGSCQRGNLENAQVSPISGGEGTSLLELVRTMRGWLSVSCWSTLANMVVRVGLQGETLPLVTVGTSIQSELYCSQNVLLQGSAVVAMSKVGLGGSLWSPVYRRSRCPRAGGEGSNRDISTTLCPTYRYYDISNHREVLFVHQYIKSSRMMTITQEAVK